LILLALAITAFGQAGIIQASTNQASTGATQSGDYAGITGEWQGAISRQRLTLKIEQPTEAPLRGTIISVDQGNMSIPIDTISLGPGGALRLDLKSISASYEGKLGADGAEISGIWQQGGASVPLLFRRPGAAAATFTLKPRTQGRIALTPCRTADGNIEALCGKYEVYENRQTQKGRKIALNIMLLPSISEKPAPDPFFALAGGPGQSATEAFPPSGFVTKVRQQRDTVLVDQRGTGGSNRLQCQLWENQTAQSIIAESYSLEKIRQCRAELEKQADLTQYTTSIAADDLDEVRQAMGYEKINVFGGSYGTKAGLVYLRMHGDHVRTLALEAVATPQYRIPLPFAKTIQSSVDRLIDRCAADAACHRDFPELRQEFNGLVDRLEKSPAHFEVQHQAVTLSRAMFVNKLRHLLYVPAIASLFPRMIHSAYQNDWTLYGAAVFTLDKSLEQVIARGASFAAICAEDIPGLTDSFIKHETAGTYLGDSQVHRYQEYCQAWGPAGAIPKDFYAPVRSRVPVLLISGVLDPATPPEMAQQAAHDLVNSRLIAIKEGTHGTGSPCIDGLISDFVQQGSAAALDASCADQIHLPPFVATSQGRAASAKTGPQ
jgi:pimeloyl-ACP methyl ester carboxylesterase